MAHLQGMPSPNQWLGETLRKGKVSQGRLCRLLGVDKSRFARWVGKKEQIPRGHLAELAQQLPPADVTHVLCLKDCEDFADQLERRAKRLFLSLGLGQRPVEALFGLVEKLVVHERCADKLAIADMQVRYLVDAIAAVNLVQQVVDVGFHQPLLPAESVPRFRFPINHFVGMLIDLDTIIPARSREAHAAEAFRGHLLENLRTSVRTKKKRSHAMEESARQFTIHVLARHGTDVDRQWIKELLQPGSSSSNPLLRRLSFTGIVLGTKDTQAIEQFLWCLRRDRSLAAVNLQFNGFHYGDISFNDSGTLPQKTKQFDRSIPHILRHLEQADQYASIIDVERLTLIHILEMVGPKPFCRSAIQSRLRHLLNNTSLQRQTNQAVQKQFRKTFRALLEGKS